MNPTAVTDGGTRPRPPLELRSPVLREHGQAVADASLAWVFATWPELVEQFGARGRVRTVEDHHWHLNFLDAAVSLHDPARFDRYADWLVGFLIPRGLRVEHVAGAFSSLAAGLDALAVPPESEAHRGELVATLRRAASRVAPGPSADA